MMNESTRIRNKKKLVIDFLQDLRDNGELDIPVHRMNINEWFSLFEQKTSQVSNQAIFHDQRYFAMQFNNIAEMSLFDSVTKKVERDPVYEVYYEVYTCDTQEDTILDFSSVSSVNETDDDDDSSSKGDGKIVIVWYYKKYNEYINSNLILILFLLLFVLRS